MPENGSGSSEKAIQIVQTGEQRMTFAGGEKKTRPEDEIIEGEFVDINDQEKSEKIQQIRDDLTLVLGEVPKDIRDDTTKNGEYNDRVREARERLNQSGIKPSNFLWKGLVIKGKDDLKELGSRKATLRGIVAKMINGQELNEEEQKAADLINIKKEDVFVPAEEVAEIIEEVFNHNNPWDRAISFIEGMSDPKTRTEARTKWFQEHLNDESIPYSVLSGQLEKINQETDNLSRQGSGESVTQNENQNNEVFSEEEKIMIIQECLNKVFFEKMNSQSEIISKGLLGGEGFLAVDLKRGKNPALSDELLGKIKELNLGSWAAMRNMVGNWTEFKDTEDIKSTSLTKRLFLDEDTEKFFAIGVCELPYVNERTGRTELKRVDLGVEIGMAMKKLRNYFEDTEYWIYIGADLSQKGELYKDLGLNKYVGEAAFSLLLSYQMLTDTSADDYLSLMVQQDKARVKKWNKAASGDAVVRSMVQEDLSNGGRIFKNEANKKSDSEVMEKRMKKILPNQLIPTGLSDGGMEALRSGNWPKWRLENLYTKAQIGIDRAAGRTAKPANDQDTRLMMMKSALDILLAMKEVFDPQSDANKILPGMTGKFYSHVNGSLRDANWLEKDPRTGTEMVPAELCFSGEYGGELQSLSSKDWVSRNMLTVCETVLYTHSIVDHLNPKPWDMNAFARNLEEMFSIESQAEKPLFVGMGAVTKKEHRKELLEYGEKLVSDSVKIADSIKPVLGMFGANSPDRFPSWWSRGVSVGGDLVRVANTMDSARGVWAETRERLKKGISRLS